MGDRRAAWQAAGVSPLWESRLAYGGAGAVERPSLWPWRKMLPLIDDAARMNSTNVIERRVLSLMYPDPAGGGSTASGDATIAWGRKDAFTIPSGQWVTHHALNARGSS